MKKITAILLTVAMLLSLCACGAAKEPAATEAPAAAAPDAPAAEAPVEEAPKMEPMALKFACAEPGSGVYVQEITAALEKVTEYTGGAMTFEIFPDNQLGTITDVMESVNAGAPIIESVGFDQLGDIVPEFMPASFPYIFQDIYEVYDLAASDWMVDMTAKVQATGITPIVLGASGYRHFISTEPIYDASSIQGKIIRMGPSGAAQGFIKVMNGTPTTSTWGDNYSLLQTGTFHACEANLEALWVASFHEVCDYLTLSGHFVTPCALIISNDYWNKIPADVQAYMTQVLTEAQRNATDSAMANESGYIEKFKEAGVEVIETDKSTFASYVPALFELMELDPAIYDEIRAAIEG